MGEAETGVWLPHGSGSDHREQTAVFTRIFPTDEQLVATNCVDVRLRDPGVGRDFVYNVASGSTAWVDVIRERDYGEIMRERWDRVSPIYLPVDSPYPRLEIWKSGHLDVMRSAKQSSKRSGKGSNKTSMK